MKKILYIFLSGILLFGTGCNDFLDRQPPLNVNENDIFSSPVRIEATLLGLYATAKNTAAGSGDGYALLGGKGLVAMDARGDDVVNVTSNNLLLMETYHMRVTDIYGDNRLFWEYAYLTINRVNTFLASLESEGVRELLGDERYNQFKAEAMFVRALCYYYLINLYGTPYIINPNARAIPLRLRPESDGTNNNLAPATVTEIYAQILTDLNDANIAALPVTRNDYATVTRATKGAAFMLRMRTYMGQANWTEAVRAGEAITGYTLATDVTATFSSPFHTSESIFSFPMALNNRPNTQLSAAEFYNPNGADVILVDVATGIMSKPYYSLDFDARSAFLNNANNRLRKYTDILNRVDWTHIFRYAETLLGLAESYANLGSAANEAKARELLKQVRHRSIDPEKDPLNIDALSGDALKEAISNERRLELLGEGVRGIDITRRGETFRKGTGVGAIIANPTDIGYLWPIPQSEKLQNEAMR
jgi:hypothetical protein